MPANGLRSASSWHVMMCSQAPVVVRNPADGTINAEESYLHVHDHGQAGTNNEDYNQKQSNGIGIRITGTVDSRKTFK